MNQDEEHKSDVIADQAGAELAELRAENERLEQRIRELEGALRKIADYETNPLITRHWTYEQDIREMKALAKEVLK